MHSWGLEMTLFRSDDLDDMLHDLHGVKCIYIIRFSLHLYQSEEDLLKTFWRSVSWSLTTRTMTGSWWDTDTRVPPWAAQETAVCPPSMTRLTRRLYTTPPTSRTLTQWQVSHGTFEKEAYLLSSLSNANLLHNSILKSICLDDFEDEDEEITCYCRKPYGGRPMIECSSCQTWVHLTCAKVKRTNIPDTWHCRYCAAKSTKGARSRGRKTQLRTKQQNPLAVLTKSKRRLWAENHDPPPSPASWSLTGQTAARLSAIVNARAISK